MTPQYTYRDYTELIKLITFGAKFVLNEYNQLYSI